MLDRLKTDMRAALKSGKKEELETIRLLIAALNNEKIAKMDDLDDSDIIAVLKREAKRRREAADAYRKGGRSDRAEAEEREEAIIRHYLPQPLTDDQLLEIVKAAVDKVGACSMRQMGQVMREVMGAHGDRLDGKRVQEVVRELLT